MIATQNSLPKRNYVAKEAVSAALQTNSRQRIGRRVHDRRWLSWQSLKPIVKTTRTSSWQSSSASGADIPPRFIRPRFGLIVRAAVCNSVENRKPSLTPAKLSKKHECHSPDGPFFTLVLRPSLTHFFAPNAVRGTSFRFVCFHHSLMNFPDRGLSMREC